MMTNTAYDQELLKHWNIDGCDTRLIEEQQHTYLQQYGWWTVTSISHRNGTRNLTGLYGRSVLFQQIRHFKPKIRWP